MHHYISETLVFSLVSLAVKDQFLIFKSYMHAINIGYSGTNFTVLYLYNHTN